MTIRIEIAKGDHFDIVIKPFHELTVEDHIRLYESNASDDGDSDLRTMQNRLMRITGAPSRFVRYMNAEEISGVFQHIDEQVKAHDNAHNALSMVKETLDKWKDEHEGADFTVADAKAVLEAHRLFKGNLSANGYTYTAPDIESSPFGKWLDLQESMVAASESSAPESESYVRALTIMMEGEDGAYPVQVDGEDDREYHERCRAYTSKRYELFMQAPWVDVMGCAAFFFSKSQRFAALCVHNMSLFRSLLRHPNEPMLRVIPKDGVATLT